MPFVTLMTNSYCCIYSVLPKILKWKNYYEKEEKQVNKYDNKGHQMEKKNLKGYFPEKVLHKYLLGGKSMKD